MPKPYEKLLATVPWLCAVIDDKGLLRPGYGTETCPVDQICWHYIHEHNSFGQALQEVYEELVTFQTRYVWNLAPWCGVKNGRIIHGVAAWNQTPPALSTFEFLFFIATKHIATAQPDIIVAAETTIVALHIFQPTFPLTKDVLCPRE